MSAFADGYQAALADIAAAHSRGGVEGIFEWIENNSVLRNVKPLNNTIAREGYDQCNCGCKYWENDRCIDCGNSITTVEGRV